MCGIIGIISATSISSKLLEGLQRLEYRGYDSTGIAVLCPSNEILRRRAEHKLTNLSNLLKEDPIDGIVGIGHTRWATHGKVTEENAHPMADHRVAVVHNGIIENFAELKAELIEKGHIFTSHTDTEVVMHLVSRALSEGLSPKDAVQKTLHIIKGAFALAFLFKDHQNLLIAARKGSPLVVGIQDKELFIGSDAIALAPWASSLIYLEEGDMAILQLLDEGPKIEILDETFHEVIRPVKQNSLTLSSVNKGDYSHYMLKEIFEQPLTLADTLQSVLCLQDGVFQGTLASLPIDFKRIRIIACGTSFYAGIVGKYWIEKWAKIPVDVEIASEFRYRSPVFTGDTLNVFITQSGETIDTLWAMNLVAEHNEKTLAIVNVAESSIARKADFVIPTLAGPEIGVASTKAFTAQLMILACLCLKIAQEKNTLTSDEFHEILSNFAKLPGVISELLRNDGVYQRLALSLSQVSHVLYLGRGLSYPIALEGALKLKEISYIHAEGYPAGELKHGPIALIDSNMPVIVIAPFDEWFDKTLSNIQEILARGAKVIVLTSEEGQKKIETQTQGLSCFFIHSLQKLHNFLTPLLYTVPIQLLAYYTAHVKGTDVDQPRNLAKSVTVE